MFVVPMAVACGEIGARGITLNPRILAEMAKDGGITAANLEELAGAFQAR